MVIVCGRGSFAWSMLIVTGSLMVIIVKCPLGSVRKSVFSVVER